MSRRKSIQESSRRLSRRLVANYLLILIALLVALASYLLYLLLDGENSELLPNIASEAIAAPLIFVVVYLFVTRPGVSLPGMRNSQDTGTLVGFYKTHEIVDWASVINGARQIDIVVHYYDSWIRDYEPEFVRLFERGGRVRIVLPDPKNDKVLEVVRQEFFPKHSLPRLREKVEDTFKYLHDALGASGSVKASLEAYAYPGSLHYSIVVADLRHVYLSVYEQFRASTIRSQVFHLDLAKEDELDVYWKDTLAKFISGSRVWNASELSL